MIQNQSSKQDVKLFHHQFHQIPRPQIRRKGYSASSSSSLLLIWFDIRFMIKTEASIDSKTFVTFTKKRLEEI
ncbi:hypothetical protein DERP_011308 [Dermatophagoides pteronyssinus]|uniref:Uncharacterized protein n=1 Tax=Dermatophagoides pteronyssinus TaxID=6956 RepID=A0ABQ8J799_DERPT|nr:hypothetical protein DERP_011308 [Dermatophagoides pteronyssinus]